ncbi:unnamed protein product [Phytophthora lilii]|uniref:Unnamed protein product n=1 Tax=Phytophthora lilii TaxID=2077276 RepID=A0A9W6TES0_9STRA|nr:unnamed protein product [Phytophthora lilii]
MDTGKLLARELRKSEGNEANAAAQTSGKPAKKPFLKRGARGWWMRQPGAKQKVVRHTLASKGEEQDAATKTTPASIGRRKEQHRRKRFSSGSSSGTLSPVTTPPEQVQKASAPQQTLSPPASPIRRPPRNSTNYTDINGINQREPYNEEWKAASFRSTTSTDIMGMKNVRQSYEAKQEQEANEMAEFEAIERDLAAEKEAYLMEKRQQYPVSTGVVHREDDHDNQKDAEHWGLPYSSFVSDLNAQEQSRWQTTRSVSNFDDSLDGEADSALVFGDHCGRSKDEWMTERDDFTNQLRDHFGYGTHFGDPPSELSAVSFDDSVPWDDGLTFQPRQSETREQPSNGGGSTDVLDSQRERYASLDGGLKVANRQVYFADNDTNEPENRQHTQERISDGDAPVSSLVQHVFGELAEDEASNRINPRDADEVDSIDGGISINGNTRAPAPAQGKSLSTLKQKLRGKQKQSGTNIPARKDKKRSIQPNATAAAPPRVPRKQKSAASTGKPGKPNGRLPQSQDSGMILPAVIEEKLYELEEEVKFYKSETLQLQKRKDYYEQEVKKLALERDEFARYQQEQRLLIEKEWERERAKMKKEEKLQERQWKMRMNATISHQDRKDRGEVESLKAQIVKMQLDEKARISKWKAGNDNLRQRELEEKNRELSDEIKFLEKDRLEQWEKYERLLQEKQGASTLSSKTKMDTPSAVSEKSELRTMDEVFAIKGTADELLQRWSLPHGGIQSKEDTNQDHEFTPTSGLREHIQPSTGGEYNPKRYSLDQEDYHSSTEPATTTGGEGLKHISVNGLAGDEDYTHTTKGTATYEWALPDAGGPDDLGYSIQKVGSGDFDSAISASTSSLSEHKIVRQEINHPDGKKEFLYTDGSRKIIFPDGNEKEIDSSGHVVIKFTNGDHKELTTYPDNRKVYEFPNQQIETSLPDGTTEIQFADGIKKTIRPNGDEFSVFPDGTTMLEQPDGLREVTLLNQKKIRYFPDGQMACVAPGGQESRVRSDSELKQLMESA